MGIRTSTITRIDTTARASKLVIAGDRVETSGLVANDCTADVAGQTRDVLAQLDELLARADVGREGLLRVQIWLADMQDFEAMNSVYDAWVGEQHQPARACVGAQLASADYLIEIQAWAQR
ncbi:Enamine deaminase RidA, house cleaning of reactive enamine intermediates, YjgF/YER057c/UK114 family [Halopseudomonas litoralis]|uniref:Enamine deaminase RidA, house cleaning of reactive enamine intermediates, YjgF/YER057c/UK114 family n=1 Tax=Halopseudomonas litoralis TaxID=797277 RepID=A0A1H1QFV0_9GAMM|nr:RidA family protein [Halopseudomonas litoralis]SDS22254.1 Enamine deaminase RidA, house cleaning of reactive enamine intermediates, YjgF/YER057c/UK114 family [Halopseudomonas litoralis]